MFIYWSCYVDLNIRNSFSRHPEDGGSRFLGSVGTVRIHIPDDSRFEGTSSRNEQLSDYSERVDFP
jgi:hypothetical protein